MMQLKQVSGVNLFVLLLASFLAFPLECMSAVYECKTEQTVMWKAGQLIPQNRHTFNGADSIIHFDDQTSEFGVAVNKDSIFSLMPFHIVKNNEEETLALYKNESDFSAGSSFYIRKLANKTKPVFMFYSMSQKAIFSGKCNVL